MNNMTIGQYIPGESWLHQLDPRIKMLSLILLLVSIFLVPIQGTIIDLSILAGYFLFTLLLVMSSGIPLLKVLQGLRPILFLLTFTVLIQIIIIRPTTLVALSETFTFYLSFTSIAAIILWIIFYQVSKKWIKFKVMYFIFSVVVVFALQYALPYGNIFQYDVTLYEETVFRALFIFFRIVVIIMLTSLLTFTTMTTDINDGLEGILFPLKWVKVPVDVLTMMVSLTLRYIPTLLIETDKIMKAQASRGVDFKEASIKDKVTQVISLLIPVFVISFKRAEDLANAMEVRGYVIGQKRTKIDILKIKTTDFIAMIGVLLIVAVTVYLVFFS
jgi:energy-coupling factor transport system permease protein